MPTVVEPSQTPSNIVGGNDIARTRRTSPLRYSGSLDKYAQNDLTPVIGREFEDLQIKDLITADDQVIQDLAVTSKLISTSHLRREVVNMCLQSLNGESSSCVIRT